MSSAQPLSLVCKNEQELLHQVFSLFSDYQLYHLRIFCEQKTSTQKIPTYMHEHNIWRVILMEQLSKIVNDIMKDITFHNKQIDACDSQPFTLLFKSKIPSFIEVFLKKSNNDFRFELWTVLSQWTSSQKQRRQEYKSKKAQFRRSPSYLTIENNNDNTYQYFIYQILKVYLVELMPKPVTMLVIPYSKWYQIFINKKKSKDKAKNIIRNCSQKNNLDTINMHKFISCLNVCISFINIRYIFIHIYSKSDMTV